MEDLESLIYPSLHYTQHDSSLGLAIDAVLFHRFTRRCGLRVGNVSCVTDVWSPYRIYWLMAWRCLWRNHVVSLYWRTCHPLLRFLCLHEVVTLPFVVAIFWPKNIVFRTRFIHLHFGDCLQWNFVLLAVKCHGLSPLLPPCARFIARDHPHSKCVKCLGFSHACDAVYEIWNVKMLWKSPSQNPPLSAWGVWKEVIHFSPSRSGGLRGFAWICDLGFGCWVHQLNSRITIFILAQGRVTVFLRAGWYIAKCRFRLRGFRACFSRCAPA